MNVQHKFYNRTYLLFLGFRVFDFSTASAASEKWMRQIGRRRELVEVEDEDGDGRLARRACLTHVYDMTRRGETARAMNFKMDWFLCASNMHVKC